MAKTPDESADEAANPAFRKLSEAQLAKNRATTERETAEKDARDPKLNPEEAEAAKKKVEQSKAAEEDAVKALTEAVQEVLVRKPKPAMTGTGSGGALKTVVTAVNRIGWWSFLLRTAATVAVVVGIVAIGYMILRRGDGNLGIDDVGFTRGLITLMLLLFVIAMASLLVIYIVTEQKSKKIKPRIDPAREVLTPLLGIFGTVIGFYFGSTDKTQTTAAEIAAVQALGGALVGDSAYFRDGTMPDADLEKLATIHPLRRLYLDHTKVTEQGLASHLVKLDDLTYLSIRGTKVTLKTKDDLIKVFKDKGKDLIVDLEVAVPATDQSDAAKADKDKNTTQDRPMDATRDKPKDPSQEKTKDATPGASKPGGKPGDPQPARKT